MPKSFFPSLGWEGIKGRVILNTIINHPLPCPPPSKGEEKGFFCFGNKPKNR